MGCGGPGRCRACAARRAEGHQLVDRERRYTVRRPAGSTGGCAAGCRARVGREQAAGRPGSLAEPIVRVRPSRFFTRESTRSGNVLIIEVPLSPVEAALGAENGASCARRSVRRARAAGAPRAQQVHLRGRGFPARDRGARGDAHVRVAVETPATVSDEAKGLLEQLGALLTDDALPRAAEASARRASARSRRGAVSRGPNETRGRTGQRRRGSASDGPPPKPRMLLHAGLLLLQRS